MAITFFCKDCRELVEPTKDEKKFSHACGVCNGKSIAMGSEKGVKEFFHLKKK